MDCGIGIRDSNWVIWDWNGTLLDDLWLTLNVTNTLLRDRGIVHLNQTQYRAVFGFPLQRYYSRIGFDFGKDSFDDLANEWCPLYEKEKERCSLFPGVASLVSLLWLGGWNQVILSAYEDKKLKTFVSEYGIGKCFSEICGLDNDKGHGKIELGSDFAEKNLNKFNRNRAVYVGDTIHDAEVARAMKINCILISHGHQNRDRLESTGCDVVDCVEELSDKLRKWQEGN